MEIRAVELVFIEKRPALRVVFWEGGEALVPYEQKALEYDYVFLGAPWQSRVPPLTLPADPENGRYEDRELTGFLHSALLANAVRQMLKDTGRRGTVENHHLYYEDETRGL